MTLYDVLIKGGEVVDPGSDRSDPLDVAITDGRVAAVEPGIPSTAARELIDATGQIVTPGLVDLHAHCFDQFTYWGIRPDPIAASTGVTTWNDAGSPGALTMAGFRRHVVEQAVVDVKCFMNISMIGLVAENYEVTSLELCDLELFQRISDLNREIVRGVKVRIGTPTVGENGVEPLRLAIRAGNACGLPVMVHIAMAPPEIDEVVDLLRPGDIVTHAFTGLTMRLVGEDGNVRGSVQRAVERGVLLDIGHGAGSFSFNVAEMLVEHGCRPDIISSDVHQLSINGPMFDLPTTMSKFLLLGMSMSEVVRATTIRPAQVLGLEGEAGTLRPGSRADIAVFRLLQGEFPLFDVHGEKRVAQQLLRNTATIVGGNRLAPCEPDPPAPWVEPTWPPRQRAFTRQQHWLRDEGYTPAAFAAGYE